MCFSRRVRWFMRQFDVTRGTSPQDALLDALCLSQCTDLVCIAGVSVNPPEITWWQRVSQVEAAQAVQASKLSLKAYHAMQTRDSLLVMRNSNQTPFDWADLRTTCGFGLRSAKESNMMVPNCVVTWVLLYYLVFFRNNIFNGPCLDKSGGNFRTPTCPSSCWEPSKKKQPRKRRDPPPRSMLNPQAERFGAFGAAAYAAECSNLDGTGSWFQARMNRLCHSWIAGMLWNEGWTPR